MLNLLDNAYHLNLKGNIAFTKRKLKTLAHVSRFRRTPLSKIYKYERSIYKASGKQTALAASGVGFAMQYKTDVVTQYHMQQNPFVASAMNKDFDQLNISEFEALARIGENIGTMSEVTYLKKQHRYQYLAIPDGNLFYDINDNPFQAHENDWVVAPRYMYAIDKYGNLFCVKDIVSDKWFNHSSFSAGGKVICAGMIDINNGKLMHIDNESGHYKPNRKQLHEAIALFHDEGVDLLGTRVKVIEYIGGQKQELNYLAYTFLTNMNAQPDWGV